MSSTNSNANKVGEIFSFAGLAFTKLGELTVHLQSNQENSGSRWDDDDIEMLRNAVKRFGDDLLKISDNIKSKATNQIKNNIKKTKYEQAKIPIDQMQATSTSNIESASIESASTTVPDSMIPPVESELEI